MSAPGDHQVASGTAPSPAQVERAASYLTEVFLSAPMTPQHFRTHAGGWQPNMTRQIEIHRLREPLFGDRFCEILDRLIVWIARGETRWSGKG